MSSLASGVPFNRQAGSGAGRSTGVVQSNPAGWVLSVEVFAFNLNKEIAVVGPQLYSSVAQNWSKKIAHWSLDPFAFSLYQQGPDRLQGRALSRNQIQLLFSTKHHLCILTDFISVRWAGL